MSLSDEIQEAVTDIFKKQWTARDGNVIPESENLRLGNDAVKIDGTVLYADLSESTGLVDSFAATFAAEVYKSYLYSAAKIIRSEGGAITAYDGDRIMAVFIGNTKNTSAARAALKVNYAVQYIINPTIQRQYPSRDYSLHQTVGIDSSELFIARTGIRGANDLVWVGRAANYAAKLCTLPTTHPTRITSAVYNKLHESLKISSKGDSMWEAVTWNPMGGITIYRSTYWWRI